MAVVTVTGKVGSGVKDLGAGIAARLGIDFVDQQLLLEAAQRLRVPVGKIAERDERVESLSQRIAAVMSSFLERSAVFGSDPLTGAVGLEAMFSRNYMDMEGAQQDQTVRDESYLRTMRGVVQELAERGDVVILGRGSPAILRDLPKALHVYCFAPIPIRIQRVARAEAISEEEAANRIAETDRALAAFYRKVWKMDLIDAAYYDLIVNSARLSIETAADMAAMAVRIKEESAQA